MEVITMEKIILIKYGELTTKKANRNLFINRIYENMKQSLANYDIKINKNRVRMFIEPGNENIDEIIDIIKKKDLLVNYFIFLLSYILFIMR